MDDEAIFSAWAVAIEAFLNWMQASGAVAGTLKVRRSKLRTLARHSRIAPWDVTRDHLIAWMNAHSWAKNTRQSSRTTVIMFYRWAKNEGLVDEDPAANLPRVRVPKAGPRPTPTTVYEEALAQATERDRLMIRLGALGGLRRSEIAKVRGTDLGDDDVLRVVGKGSKVRLIPIVDRELLRALNRAGGDYLFPGKIDGHISPGHVGVLLSRVLGPGWTGHTLRHRCATRAFKGTRDLLAVQELLGHASPVTTAIYTAVPANGVLDAVIAAA
ncbi:Site-specific recombinase XerD [Frankineae bacterium MT45]|nr:Site-specific recombinase XerD [Frankineae bacterium MT45]